MVVTVTFSFLLFEAREMGDTLGPEKGACHGVFAPTTPQPSTHAPTLPHAQQLLFHRL
jgi:hypothetical protein